jgi:hypothetical protein
MTTNHEVVAGIVMGLSKTNAPAAIPHSGNVVTAITKAQPVDPMLDESEHILEDYISLLSKSASLIANQ